MPFVISKAVAATAITAAVASTTPQPVCYYAPVNHVYWDRIETVVEVVCVPAPPPR